MSQKHHSQPVHVAMMKNGTSTTSPQPFTMMTMVVPDDPARNFFSKCRNHTHLWTSKKVWSLLTINQKVCLAQDERRQKEG